MHTLSIHALLIDHPSLRAVASRESILPNSTYKWIFDAQTALKYHDLSRRWLVKIVSADLPSFTWWMDIRTVFVENQIAYRESNDWVCYLQSKIGFYSKKGMRRMSLNAANTCAQLAVRNLPGYPVSFV